MYTDLYGLSDKPFQLTPDPRFWFGSRTHQRAMAYLGYGLAQAEGFIVVTGEIGAGKSTLAAHLLATIDRSRLTAVSVSSTQVEGDDLLRLIAGGLGVAADRLSKAALLDAAEQALLDETARGKRVLLVIDEAQNLGSGALEELRLLSNFQAGGRALVQILVLGQPEFRDRLAAEPGLEQLRQRVIASHHLHPMTEEEVEPYLRHRLGAAGWAGRPALSADLAAAVFRHAGGLPRRINQLMNRVLLLAGVEARDAIDAATVDSAAEDLAGERPQAAPQPVLPLRSVPSVPAATEQRIAALEAQLAEQDAVLRRVLTMLVGWIENVPQPRAA